MISKDDKALIICKLKEAEWQYLDSPDGEYKTKMLWWEHGCRAMASVFLTKGEIDGIVSEMKEAFQEYLREKEN